MALGGLAAEAFAIVFGNPDVMALIITFTIAISLLMIVFKIYEWM